MARINSPSQFSKFTALPQISQRNGSAGNGYGDAHGKGTIDGLEAEERVRQLETRISVTEKSNRALLEEVVRLQGELKVAGRRNDDTLRDERLSRQQLENGMRATNELLQQIAQRLLRTEERVQEERVAISTLVGHTKSVEQAVLGSQQELLSRRDVQNSKLAELRQEIDEIARARDAAERTNYSIGEELRQVKAKLDAQQNEFSATSSELKMKAKKLEEENRQMRLDNMRKQTESSSVSDQALQQIRTQTESRLAELRDAVIGLRNTQDAETQGRRILEQQTTARIGELQTALAEQSRKREEAMHALEAVQREREHAAETERLKLLSRIAQISEEVSQKILQKELKLRDDTVDRCNRMEKMLLEDRAARVNAEAQIRTDLDERHFSLKNKCEDELEAMREIQKGDRIKYAETLQKLDEAVNILEEQVDEQKKQYDKVMAAEIKSRKQHEAFTLEKVEDLQEKLGLGITTLQQALAGVAAQLEKDIRQLQKAAGQPVTESDVSALARAAAAVPPPINEKVTDEKLQELEKKIMNALKKSAADTFVKLNEKTSALEQLEAQIASLQLSEEQLKKTDRDLERKLRDLADKLSRADNRTDSLRQEMSNKISVESEGRGKDMDSVRRELFRLAQAAGAGRGPPAAAFGNAAAAIPAANTAEVNKLKTEVQECQDGVRKLAESLQTVKTVLGMKIQAEQKLRIDEAQKLRLDIDDALTRLEPLIRTQPAPRVFIKENPTVTREKAERNARPLNKWTIPGARKWDAYKKALMARRPRRPGSQTETTLETEDVSTLRRDDLTPSALSEYTVTAPAKKPFPPPTIEETEDDEAATEVSAEIAAPAKKRAPPALEEEDDDATVTETEPDIPAPPKKPGATAAAPAKAAPAKPAPARKPPPPDDDDDDDDEDDATIAETEPDVPAPAKKPAAAAPAKPAPAKKPPLPPDDDDDETVAETEPDDPAPPKKPAAAPAKPAPAKKPPPPPDDDDDDETVAESDITPPAPPAKKPAAAAKPPAAPLDDEDDDEDDDDESVPPAKPANKGPAAGSKPAAAPPPKGAAPPAKAAAPAKPAR